MAGQHPAKGLAGVHSVSGLLNGRDQEQAGDAGEGEVGDDRGGVRGDGSLLRWGIMADRTPSARLDLMSDQACVLVSAGAPGSLMALQAGALEIRPDLPPDEVSKTAGLIRSTARQAMTELRDIIGVLHDGEHAEAPLAPQPTLRDIGPLVDGYRKAGLKVRLDMSVDESGAVPGPLGRDAYRIVREALTNVSKHAATTAAVTLSGCAGEGLLVEVRNKLPVGGVLAADPAGELPGSGLGLVSLAERVALAGGTLTHGADGGGDFVLIAAFPWEG